ncbi:hypothetical protein [Microbispora sp. NPDC049125]|uniref:hypothetical protein n=1 Tax=Microbispora sp. NPDC049125 TaxID=3154929 RepID=UPI003464F934
MTTPNPDRELTVEDILDAEPIQHITDEARERGTCSQCGNSFSARACGPTHAVAKRELGLI